MYVKCPSAQMLDKLKLKKKCGITSHLPWLQYSLNMLCFPLIRLKEEGRGEVKNTKIEFFFPSSLTVAGTYST